MGGGWALPTAQSSLNQFSPNQRTLLTQCFSGPQISLIVSDCSNQRGIGGEGGMEARLEEKQLVSVQGLNGV
jgi:hypothetical protein